MNLADLPPEARARVSAIVEELLDRPAPDRAARADQLCGGDATLRAAVAAVIGYASEHDASFHAAVRAAVQDASGAQDPVAEGQRLGPYRLLRLIGHGGMGAVYLAARDDQEFELTVAIKVVRGLFGPDTLPRFRAERQMLASLDHPHIARLLDGGTTADGVPYLVMEYVDGQPLDEYCRVRTLGVRECLSLFADVCDAVAYAHARLIVHRDLKPSNILVTAAGVPKLLDFGIAKLLADDGGSRPITGTVALTPAYASPEQALGGAVTTATDVYSLGVVLYELLTGGRPTSRTEGGFSESAPSSAAREVERPSVAAARADRAAIARPRELRGDLDTIVLTALDRDPARRYRSAEALCDDIRRYLAAEPIRARPATMRYRAKRFIARHRAGVAAAALLVLLGLGWTGTTIVQSARVARERDTAQEMTRFLVDLFASSDPAETRSQQVSARELIDRGAAQLPSLAGRPEVHVRLLETIGRVYQSLGAYDRAATMLEDAVGLRDRLEGRESADTAATLDALGDALRLGGTHARAEALLRESLALRQRLLGARHPDVAESLNNLALSLRAQSRLDDAEPLLRDALDIWRETLGPDGLEVSQTLMNLAAIARDRSKFPEAEALVREALDIRRRRLPDPHPLLAGSLMTLSQVLDARGDDRNAETMMVQAFEMRRKIYGDRHVMVAQTASNLASVKQDLGDLDGAEPLYQMALTTFRELLGRHTETAVAANNFATLLEERGRVAEAESLLRESLAIRREVLGAEHPAVARVTANLARLLFVTGRTDAAEPLAREALALRRQRLGEAHFETAQSLQLMAKLTAARGQRRDAEVMLRDALGRLQKTLNNPVHPMVNAATHDLGVLLLEAGRPAEAEPLLRAVAEERRRSIPQHYATALSDVWLGRTLVALGRAAEGRALMASGQRRLTAALPANDLRLRAAMPQR